MVLHQKLHTEILNNAVQNPENITQQKDWYTPTKAPHKSLHLLQITYIASLQLCFMLLHSRATVVT